MRRPVPALLLLLTLILATPLAAATPEYRGYWVETFNTPFATQQDVLRIVDAAVQSNANAIFMQVRRRGDAWYLDAKEPLTESAGFGEPDASGRPTLDPLRFLIEQAHARNVEVHAFVIVTAVYRDDPATKLPADPGHVFLQHVWDRAAGAPYGGARQWATRALPHNSSNTTYDGQRFGTEWYLDLGHPDAAAYTIDVLSHLVRRYDLDGIHLDRIRYPEAPIDGSRAINVGYNETSVARFRTRFGEAARYYTAADVGTGGITSADVGYPRTDDPLWQAWRRDQVTEFVRRLYLTAKSIRPAIRVSAALITFGNGPAAAGGFVNTEAYWRVFQDWEGWSRQGFLDALVPMVYKRAHSTSESAAFDDWTRFTIDLAHGSGTLALPGLAAYLNGIEGTLRQIRSARGAGADGVVFYALGNTAPGSTTANSTNAAVTSNPFSYPTAGQSTPKRPNEDFFSALKSGGSGTTRFEAPSNEPVFGEPVQTPALPPRTYVSGVVPGTDGATVTVQETSSGASFTAKTDGNGFWGFAGLPAGLYRATSGDVVTCGHQVEPGVPLTIEMKPCGPRRRAVGVR